MKIELKFIKLKFNFQCKVEQKFAEDTSRFPCITMRINLKPTKNCIPTGLISYCQNMLFRLLVENIHQWSY